MGSAGLRRPGSSLSQGLRLRPGARSELRRDSGAQLALQHTSSCQSRSRLETPSAPPSRSPRPPLRTVGGGSRPPQAPSDARRPRLRRPRSAFLCVGPPLAAPAPPTPARRACPCGRRGGAPDGLSRQIPRRFAISAWCPGQSSGRCPAGSSPTRRPSGRGRGRRDARRLRRRRPRGGDRRLVICPLRRRGKLRQRR